MAALQAGWLPVAGFWLLLFVVAAAESLWPFHREQRDHASRFPTNFGLGILSAALLSFLPVTGVVAAQWSQAQSFGFLHKWAAPPALAVVTTIIVRSLLAYGLHRLAHVSPALWRIHSVHHCDTAVDLSSGLRHHPLELLYVALASASVAALLGLSAAALAAYELAAVAFALWTHANLRLPERLDRGIGSVVVTPAVHHVHHSARQVETDSNYGEVFTLWDRLFGTYRAPSHQEVLAFRFGLGDEHEQGAANMIVQI